MLFLLEITIRVLFPQKMNLFQFNPYYGATYIPNTTTIFKMKEGYDSVVTTDSFGFRDIKRNVTKPPGVFRIMVLGDSITASTGVPRELRFTEVLEKQLNEKDKIYEVLNRGIGGWSLSNQYLYLKYKAKEYLPDLIILQIFISNDIIEFERNKLLDFNTTFGIIEKIPLKKHPTTASWRYWINSKSSLYRLFSTSILSNSFIKDFVIKMGLYPKTSVGFMYEGYTDGFFQNLNKTKLLLENFFLLSKEMNSKLLVIICPDFRQIYKADYYKLKNEYPSAPAFENITYPQRVLVQFIKKKNIPVIDLTDYFKHIDNWHLIGDGHLNKYGSKVTSRIIYKNLINSSLLINHENVKKQKSFSSSMGIS